MLGLLFLLLLPLTWKTTQANEAIVLPPITFRNRPCVVEWGDSTSDVIGTSTWQEIQLNHTYATPGLYNVSINNSIYWSGIGAQFTTNATTKTKLVDIVSWGDVFEMTEASVGLFQDYINLKVSAPPDNQPVFVFLRTSLIQMFFNTSFNSPLNWDLTNVGSLASMFRHTPLNQPITFRNTQSVQSMDAMFMFATSFNQPFHFDASGLEDVGAMFQSAYAFNQVVNLTNSTKLYDVDYMFLRASSFNQPVHMNTDSVLYMGSMFRDATKFNQPVNFNTSKVLDMSNMFDGAEAFNQPINFNVPELVQARCMFCGAKSFNQPVLMNTSDNFVDAKYMFATESFTSSVTFTVTANVTEMGGMFSRAKGFTQDLSRWDTRAVTSCSSFCPSCGLPSFPLCTPCDPNPLSPNTSMIITDPLTNISRCKGATTTTSFALATGPSSLTWLVLGASIVLALGSGGSNP